MFSPTLDDPGGSSGVSEDIQGVIWKVEKDIFEKTLKKWLLRVKLKNFLKKIFLKFFVLFFYVGKRRKMWEKMLKDIFEKT